MDDFGRAEVIGNVWKLDESGKLTDHDGGGWMLWVKSMVKCYPKGPTVKTNQYLDGPLSVSSFQPGSI